MLDKEVKDKLRKGFPEPERYIDGLDPSVEERRELLRETCKYLEGYHVPWRQTVRADMRKLGLL